MFKDELFQERITTRDVALAGVFSAVVFVFTTVFAMAVPTTGGFFNIGEAGVFLAALVGGPFVGAAAGALGSSLADISLGYGVYAPGTFIIKGLEGFIAGYLFKYVKEEKENLRLIAIAVVSVALAIVGLDPFFDKERSPTVDGSLTIFTGINIETLLKLNFTDDKHPLLQYGSIDFKIPDVVFLIVAVVFIAIILYAEFRMGETGKMLTSCLIAGAEMVLGYFLYEAIILGFGFEAASFEVLVNVAQVTFGIGIALPVVTYLKELGIIAEREKSVGTL